MDISKKILKANCYKFFAECFYYPEENQLKKIKNYVKIIPESLGGIIKYLGKKKELQIQFSRLFIGPFKVLAAPYGSVYLEEGKTTQGDSTLEVMKIYQEENLNVDLKEPADHIAIELEFMYYLITNEINAINDGDLGKTKLYQSKQYSFLNRHLSQWIPEFTDAILNNSENEFYKKIATSLNLMVREELALMNNVKK